MSCPPVLKTVRKRKSINFLRMIFFTPLFTPLFTTVSPQFHHSFLPTFLRTFHHSFLRTFLRTHAASASFNSPITAFISSPKSWYILPHPPGASKGGKHSVGVHGIDYLFMGSADVFDVLVQLAGKNGLCSIKKKRHILMWY